MQKQARMKQKNSISVQTLARIGVLTALASILFLIEIPVGIPLYKLDLSNLPVLLGSFSMGSVAGIVILVLKDLIGAVLHSGTGGVGELADCIMGLALMLPASLMYKKKKTRSTALWGLVIGTVLMIVTGIVTNKYILFPVYGMPISAGVEMARIAIPYVDTEVKFLLIITGGFNLLKAVILSILTLLLYKPLSPFLHGKGLKR